MFYQLKKYVSVELVLLLFFLISLPLKNSLNTKSIFLIGIYTVYYYSKTKHFNLSVFKILSLFIIYFILVCLSLLYTSDISYGLKLLSRFLPFLIFPFVFSILKINKKTINTLFLGFVYWMTILGIYSHITILQKLYANNDILFNLFNLNYSYLNLSKTIDLSSTYYAMFMVMSIAFLINFIFKTKSKLLLLFYFLIVIYQSFFIFHLSGRTPIFTLVILFFTSILYYIFNSKEYLKGFSFLLLLIIFIGLFGYNVRTVKYRFQHIFGFTYSNGIHHEDGLDKLKQWEAAISANNNLVFGNGIGDADNSIVLSNKKYGLIKFAKREYNAHNQFIQTYVGLGTIGLFALLYLFYNYVLLFFRRRFFLGFGVIILFFILFQTESYLQRHNGIVFFSFVLGLLVVYANQNKEYVLE